MTAVGISAGAPFAWFVFDREPRSEIEFTMARMSWRAPYA